MYSVILVDDRIDVIEGISVVIDWKSLGCELAGWALNGRDALQLIDQYKPHIIISDIKMPIMDGLELVETIKAKIPKIRFVILSGYDDFSYVQKAVRFGVDEYLLKPIGAAELSEVIARLVSKLDQDVRIQEQIYSAKKQLILSLPLLRDSFFHKLVSTEKAPPLQEITDQFSFLEIIMPLRQLALVVIELNHHAQLKQECGYNVVDSYMFAIDNIAKESFAATFMCESFRFGTDKVAVLIHMDRIGLNDIEKVTNTLQNFIRQELKLSTFAGASQIFDDITVISSAFVQALEALSFGHDHNSNRLILYDKLPPTPSSHRVQYLGLADQLLQAIRAGQEQEILQLTQRFFETNKNVQLKLLQNAVKEMFLAIRHYLFDSLVGLDLPCDSAFEELPSGSHSVEELHSWLIRQIGYMQEIAASQMLGQSKLYVEQAKAIIKSKYATALSLSVTAGLIGLSPTYLSTIFRENEGVTFTDYMISVRIEKACQLLLTRKYKVNEVARMVGYTDIRHFSELFKKRTGYNPKEYVRG